MHSLLRIYSWYRLILALLLLGIFFGISGRGLFGNFQPLLYLATTVVYAVLNLAVVVWTGRRPLELRPRHYFALFVVDIAALVLLVHASGGVSSGFGILLLVTVAAAAIFVPGQIAILVAAVATLGILAETVYDILYLGGTLATLLPAGLLGLLLFLTSILVQGVARRVRLSEELAEQKSEEVSSLQQLNQLIVQRMRTGIIVVDDGRRIQVINEAARSLLGDPGPRLPDTLVDALEHWRRGEPSAGEGLRPSDSGPRLQVSFATLQHPEGDGTLLFLEDQAQITQRAQQLKLASLGRLTASIAHEIRNPLGAMSHAAQLLNEEESLDEAERQLLEIILKNGRRMNEVIENVLTLSRGHQPRPERLDLLAWLHQFARDFHHQTGNGKPPRIDVDAVDEAGITVNIDPGHLRQVMTNLVQNGLRYSERATGTPSVLIRVGMANDTEAAVVDVIDEGPGISDEDSRHVFEPFFTTESGGTGLGLYLARELCEANQARLDYLRDAGKSCFRLSFAHPDRGSVQAQA
jgi:two-component system sensor histidine kinase PilS (NtrC family)